MARLRFGIIGTGFWARFQLAGWHEFSDEVECVALYNRTVSKAESLGEEFGVPSVYGDAAELMDAETLDFVDIITDVDTHSPFVHMAAERGLAVICQKPMAPSYPEAEKMVKACREAGVPYFIHENFRWQTPIRGLKKTLEEAPIGHVFRAHLFFRSSFPVFDNQPFLKELEQFILTDVGSHILDVARFLFGEAETLYCQTQRTRDDIKGENVATVTLNMKSGATVICELAYSSKYSAEVFPQTLALVEGSKGSVELNPDYWIRVNAEERSDSKQFAPPHYDWADPEYDVVHSSIVPCNGDILAGLKGEREAENTGEDNLKTMELVYKSYESAESNSVISVGGE